MMTRVERVELTLREAMEHAIKVGWAPMPGPYTGNTGTCCALGSLFVDEAEFHEGPWVHARGASFSTAADRLGIGYSEAHQIASGFDDRAPFYGETEFYELGVRIRKDYCNE